MTMGTGRVLTGVGLAAVSAAIVVALLANQQSPEWAEPQDELRVPQALAGTPILTSVRGQAALEASRLLWRMNRRMAAGTKVFSAPRPQELRGRTVFVAEDLGQVHYYYQSGTRLLWLGVPPGPHIGTAIEALLELYP